MDNKFVLGTAIKVTSILDTTATPTSVTIIIEDPFGTNKVDSASMTEETGGVWSYVWQTEDSASYEVGLYDAIISVTNDGYTSVERQTFELIDVTD